MDNLRRISYTQNFADMEPSVLTRTFKKHQIELVPRMVGPRPMPPVGRLPRAHLRRSQQDEGFKQKVRIREAIVVDGRMIERPKMEPRFRNNQFSQRNCGCLSCCPEIQRNMTSFLKKFDKFLNKCFKKLGRLVARRTGYFIIIPILLSFSLATGVQRVRYEANPEYLFSPRNGPARQERSLFEHHFPTNFTNFDPSRITRTGRFLRFIISARDGGSIMRQEVWDDIIRVNHWVTNFSVRYDEDEFRYEDLCASWSDKCYENKILQLYDFLPMILNGSYQLSYPVFLNPHNFQVFILPIYFGGVTVDQEGLATHVKALSIYYWLKSGSPKENKRALFYERAFVVAFNSEEFQHVRASKFTSQTLEDELEVNTTSVVPFFGITVSLIIIFCMATLFMSDWVRAKPCLGFLGIVSTMLACVSAFGLLMYAGIPFIGINLAAPFLMLGIGIDDMFVMLAAWRRTRIQESVEVRLSEAYAEAAVSITITSLTDMVSFFIGAITPFPSVQIFCIYTGMAVFMTYLWQITFFGACMAIAGGFEGEQKHAIFCHTVKAKSIAEKENGCCYTFWCAGGINRNDPWNPRDNKPHIAMILFRDTLGYILNLKLVKGIVLVLFLLYLGGAIYGCFAIEEGLERKKLSRYDSYSVEFYNMEDLYFREYPYRIQVMITGDVEYSDSKTRKELLNLHEKFENLSYIAGNLYTESWIRGWYEFVDNNSPYLNIDISKEEDFIYHLRELYLSGDDNVYKLDVKFNENFTRIIASRFIIQSYNIRNSNADKEMMNALRTIAQTSGMEVTVCHPLFIFFDQFVLVKRISIQAICFAALAMMVVSLLFIPNPWCSLWVGFSIISIEVGVVGYMALWEVNLDSISMINLIMCIGFSVDFSAHISYSFLTAKVKTPEERVKHCLFTLGLPIMQGAISTILGVLAFVAAPSYIFVTFFKTVFLVIFFGAIHGILLLPVLLSLLGPGSSKKSSPSVSFSENGRTMALKRPTAFVIGFDEEIDSDKDLGLGTSGESSSDNSFSKSTGAKLAAAQVAKNCYGEEMNSNQLVSLPAFSDKGFVSEEAITHFKVSGNTKICDRNKKIVERVIQNHINQCKQYRPPKNNTEGMSRRNQNLKTRNNYK